MDPDNSVTVVIPTLNSAEHIGDCLKSIVSSAGNELGKSIFVLVQDGNSIDSTVDVLQPWLGPGIKLVSERDSGIYDAMNRGAAASDTAWILFLGADDRLLPGFRLAARGLIDQSRVYYGNVVRKRAHARYDGTFTPIKLIFRNICHQSIFYPRALLLKSPFSLKYSIKSDWAKNIELMSLVNFEHIEQDIAVYNDIDGISATERDLAFLADKAALFRRHFGLLHWIVAHTAPIPTFLYQRLGLKSLSIRRAQKDVRKTSAL